MRVLAALLLTGCVAVPTQQPVPEPYVGAFDVGNLSIRCAVQGLLLRYLLIEGDAITKAVCDRPPTGSNEGTKP